MKSSPLEKLAALRLSASKQLNDLKQELRHGVDCPKAPHSGTGYLHDFSDDRVYDVDGVPYCGRCHYWMGCPVENILRKNESKSYQTR